jgi:hypothetical protein
MAKYILYNFGNDTDLMSIAVANKVQVDATKNNRVVIFLIFLNLENKTMVYQVSTRFLDHGLSF